MCLSLPILLAALLTACGGGGASAPGDDALITPLPIPDVPLDIPITDLVVDPGTTPGSVVLRFTAPGKAEDTAPSAYRVLVSRRHITALDRSHATPHTPAMAPATPGSSEAVILGGLERDRTLQFAVLAMDGSTEGAFGFAAGGRVAGRDVPDVPGGAILLSGPATLSSPGATYALTQDITASGSAFQITVPNVTLDLNGHTVTYGTGGSRSHGVYAEYAGGNGTITVRNGTITQAATNATYGHGVYLRGVDDVRVSYLQVTTRGPDAVPVSTLECDDVRVDHCSLASLALTVTNRHYPGVAALYVEHASGEVEIDENVVTASAQWGIVTQGLSETTSALIHHNRVVGTKARVANSYMIGAHAPRTEVYENLLDGESRGIHVDGIDAGGIDAYIHDNDISFRDQPNAEYPTHWAHGIKIEGGLRCRIEHNRVRGVADAAHADSYALDVTQDEATGIVIRGNLFQAVTLTPGMESRAVSWTYGADASTSDFLALDNVFVATDILVHRYWSGGTGGAFRANWWVRDLSQGAGQPFSAEYFFNGDDISSLGHRFIDAWPPALLDDVEQRPGAGPYETTREGTLTVRVLDGSAPLSGVTVTVRNADGATLWSRSTDAEGRASGIVLADRVTNGPLHDLRGPHRVTASMSGFTTWEGTLTVAGRTAMGVDLRAGTGAVDTTPPTQVADVDAHPLSASRALLRWPEAEDDVGVSAYLVTLDGKPAAITRQAGVWLGGLAAATTHVVTVQALDAGGNAGPASAPVTLVTRPEDRGP